MVDYHRSYYRPDNLCVIVTGQVGFKDLCDAAAPVIESIRRSERFQTLAPLERPFSSPVPRPSEHHEGRIEFPAEDEKNGAICELCWHGPRWEDLEAVTALKVLLAYLCQDFRLSLEEGAGGDPPTTVRKDLGGFARVQHPVDQYHVAEL